jgi:hypothetical protein
MSSEPKKNNKTMLWVGIGGGVLLLGCCCLGLAGTGAYFLWFAGPSLDQRLVGKWVPDTEFKGGKDVKIGFPGHIEFKSDGSVIDTSPLTPIVQGKWKVLSKKDDTVKVEMTGKDEIGTTHTDKLDIRVIDSSHLRITNSRNIEVAVKKG